MSLERSIIPNKNVFLICLIWLFGKCKVTKYAFRQSCMKPSDSKAFPLRSTSKTYFMSAARRTRVVLHREMVILTTRLNTPPIT